MRPNAPKPLLACTAPFGFAEDPARVLDAFAGLGCVACQCYRRVDDPLDAASRQTSIDTGRVLLIAERAGLRFDSIHGVFSDTINPSSPDPSHRAVCAAIYEDEARLARSLGGSMVVVHPGAINPGKRWMSRGTAVAAQAECAPFLSDFLVRLADVGERVGITFMIENLPYSCANGFDPTLVAAQIRRTNSPRIRMCFDTGHAHCTVDSVAEAIRVCADVIGYFHIHDNRADADSHLVPGDGTIHWQQVSDAIRLSQATRMLELFQPASVLERLEDTGFAARVAGWLHTSEEG